MKAMKLCLKILLNCRLVTLHCSSSKEKKNYTIDLLITMVTDEIAEETGKDRKEILTDFLCSKTGKALYDEKTKLFFHIEQQLNISKSLRSAFPNHGTMTSVFLRY